LCESSTSWCVVLSSSVVVGGVHVFLIVKHVYVLYLIRLWKYDVVGRMVMYEISFCLSQIYHHGFTLFFASAFVGLYIQFF